MKKECVFCKEEKEGVNARMGFVCFDCHHKARDKEFPGYKGINIIYFLFGEVILFIIIMVLYIRWFKAQ